MDQEIHLADGSEDSHGLSSRWIWKLTFFLKDLGTPLADVLETNLANGPGDSPV
jgi:hypothetical protein